MTLPSGYTLRPATVDDAHAVHAVMMAAGMDPRSSWVRSTVADIGWSLGKGGGFLAVQGARPVGCVGYRPDGFRTLTLNKLTTLPEVRGQGIGAALVRAVEEQARVGGFGQVLLAVSQYNLSVLPFYEHLGYAVTDDRYAYAHPDSPAPVVLVNGLPKIVSGPAQRAGERLDLQRLREQGSSFVELVRSSREAESSPASIGSIFGDAFDLSLPCAHEVGSYAATSSSDRVAAFPEWQAEFGEQR